MSNPNTIKTISADAEWAEYRRGIEAPSSNGLVWFYAADRFMIKQHPFRTRVGAIQVPDTRSMFSASPQNCVRAISQMDDYGSDIATSALILPGGGGDTPVYSFKTKYTGERAQYDGVFSDLSLAYAIICVLTRNAHEREDNAGHAKLDQSMKDAFLEAHPLGSWKWTNMGYLIYKIYGSSTVWWTADRVLWTADEYGYIVYQDGMTLGVMIRNDEEQLPANDYYCSVRGPAGTAIYFLGRRAQDEWLDPLPDKWNGADWPHEDEESEEEDEG